jgi:ABC-type transport system substrate-binding protein
MKPGDAILTAVLSLLVLVPPRAIAEPSAPGHGTLRLARLFDPLTLDAAKMQMAEDILLVPLLHQTLLDVRDGTNLVSGVARSWRASHEMTVYTVLLNPEVRFSNGRPVVANDFVSAIERILTPATASMWSVYFKGVRGSDRFTHGLDKNVQGVSAPAPDTLVIELEKPDPTFGFVLAQLVPNPPEEIARLGDAFSIRPVGAGPYIVQEWRRGARLFLVPNPAYHGLEPRHFDAIDILIGGDETTHLMMFERGELDVASISANNIPLASFRRLRQDPRWRDQFEFTEEFTTLYLTLNTEVAPLDNVRVRRAINHAVNRDKWARVGANFAVHAEGAIPRLMPGFDPSMKGYAYDPERARTLLEESGLPLPLHTVLWHGLDEPTHYLAQGVQEDLRRIGIEVQLKPVTFAQLVSASAVPGKVPMSTMAWTVSVPDPVDMLGTQFDGRLRSSEATTNFAFYENPEVDRLLDEAAPEVNLPRRYQLYQQAERLILQDAPWVFLGHRNHYGLRQPYLKGPWLDPLWIYRLDRLWAEK